MTTLFNYVNAVCERRRMPWAKLSQERVVLACACGEDGCEGWVMILNKPEMIEDHLHFRAPEGLPGFAGSPIGEPGAESGLGQFSLVGGHRDGEAGLQQPRQ